MLADGPPAAVVSLCDLARQPRAYAGRTVSIRALVIPTPGGGARLLDAGRPNDEHCAVAVSEFPPNAPGQPPHPDRAEAILEAAVTPTRRVDFGYLIVNYSLREVTVVRWGR
jgi:hypothetical protein